jgi:hypothetical protein
LPAPPQPLSATKPRKSNLFVNRPAPARASCIPALPRAGRWRRAGSCGPAAWLPPRGPGFSGAWASVVKKKPGCLGGRRCEATGTRLYARAAQTARPGPPGGPVLCPGRELPGRAWAPLAFGRPGPASGRNNRGRGPKSRWACAWSCRSAPRPPWGRCGPAGFPPSSLPAPSLRSGAFPPPSPSPAAPPRPPFCGPPQKAGAVRPKKRGPSPYRLGPIPLFLILCR